MRHIGEVANEVLAEMALPPLVTIEGDLVTFYDRANPGFTYDFTLGGPMDALRWIRHMAPKQWVTKQHLELFAIIAIERGHRA